MSARRELKKELQRAYAAPRPQRKREFLMKLGMGRCSLAEFFLTQLGYIRKRGWILSAVIFAGALWAGSRFPGEAVWIVSAGTPFLALTALTENGRSAACGMQELEAATRFSLRSVLLARMGGLGLAHGILLLLLILFSTRGSLLPVAVGGLYILVPYLLTACIGTAALRRWHGREAVYLCAGIPAFVSGALYLMQGAAQIFYNLRNVRWWVAAFLLLAAAALRENYLLYKQTEELSWSLR